MSQLLDTEFVCITAMVIHIETPGQKQPSDPPIPCMFCSTNCPHNTLPSLQSHPHW